MRSSITYYGGMNPWIATEDNTYELLLLCNPYLELLRAISFFLLIF